MIYRDPLTNKEIPVKSVYVPSRTLLQGRPYHRNNYFLNPMQRRLPWQAGLTT